MMFKRNKESGQASRMLLVLAIIILVAVIIVYLIMRMAEKPPRPIDETTAPKEVLPVYETQLGTIKFIFQSAVNLGKVLSASQTKNQSYSYLKDVTTTEKFIQVTVGAQNQGAENTQQGSWDTGDIVDSEGRHFVSIDQYAVAPWLPPSNYCGALLKPAFTPLSCTRIYEVSKESSGLKIEVFEGRGSTTGKKNSALLDLIVK